MADAIISVVAERVSAIIEDQIRYEVNLVRGVEKEVLDLSDKLKTIRNVLDDAEKRGVNEQSVKNWLKKLEDTAYEMDDILDEWNYSLLKHKMEDAAVASAKQKVCCSFIPSSCICFKKVAARRDTAMKIQNVKVTLDQILREKDDFNFLPPTNHVLKSCRVQSTSSIELEKVRGLDIGRNKNDMVGKLRLNGDIQVLSIVGMGGLGKTTLAQIVYNDSQLKDSFKLRIWICVSNPFDVAGIARGIVESVTKEIVPPNFNQLELVLEKLRDCISGKKFLLVLDDVWTEDHNKWEPLKINLKYGAPNSKILVTTRNERVAKMMGTLDDDIYRPQQLSDEECWSLLRCVSLPGRSEEECREYEDVGKKIARKCNGLPLAANVLGSHLQFMNSLEEWKRVLESEIWQLEKAEVDLFPHLVLSYNELSPDLKRCFSYCAIYPKDYLINVERLIEEWMALGYLGSVSGNGGVQRKGREYFNNLAIRSLFQEFKKTDVSGEQIEWCKMHDIVHDFAQFLRKNVETRKRSCDPCLVYETQEYRSLFWDKGGTPDLCDCCTSLRVLRFNSGRDGLPQGMERLIHLRWLDLTHTALSEEDLKIICRLYFLQTLLLVRCSLGEIPNEIGNLVQLRHLDLSSSKKLKKLPENMFSLPELQTLSLAYCYLEEIPSEIGNLVQLRHLDLSLNELKKLPESMCSLLELQILNIKYCRSLNGLPEGILRLQKLQHLLNEDTPASKSLPRGLAELSGLRTLSSFYGGSGCNKLGMLKNLNHLTGSLELKVHSSSMSDLKELVDDAGEAELRNKIHIQSLKIEFEEEMGEEDWSSSSLWMDVIEALEPNQKLEDLRIWRYKGSRLPHWMSSPLNLIKEIHLGGSSEVSSLSAMGKLPFLEILFIGIMYGLKLVGREFLGIESSSSNDVVVAFPKLKKLGFNECPKWEDWEDITAEEEESAVVSLMPCLTELSILLCNDLKKLPHRLLRKASSLRILQIGFSSELLKSYEDKEGSPWRSISQYNPHLQLTIPLG